MDANGNVPWESLRVPFFMALFSGPSATILPSDIRRFELGLCDAGGGSCAVRCPHDSALEGYANEFRHDPCAGHVYLNK